MAKRAEIYFEYSYNYNTIGFLNVSENHLLDIRNKRTIFDESTQHITLPLNFCNIVVVTEELVQEVFSNIAQNYKNHQRLSARAILTVKNDDVNDINITVESLVSC